MNGALAQCHLGSHVVAREAILLADALEITLGSLLRDAELISHGLHRLARTVEGHYPAFLGAETRTFDVLAGVQCVVELGRNVGFAVVGGANGIDDHARLLALHEISQCTGGESFADERRLGVGAHEHRLHPGRFERGYFQGHRNVVFEVEVE